MDSVYFCTSVLQSIQTSDIKVGLRIFMSNGPVKIIVNLNNTLKSIKSWDFLINTNELFHTTQKTNIL